MIPNPDRNIRCLLGGRGLGRILSVRSRSLPYRVNRFKAELACVRSVRSHKRGHKKTWEREYIGQRDCCPHSRLRVNVIVVFVAVGEQVGVVVFGLFHFLGDFLSFSFSFRFAFVRSSKKLLGFWVRKRDVSYLGPMDHSRPLVTKPGLLVVRPCCAEYDSRRSTAGPDERPNISIVVVVDIVVSVLMNVVDNLEISAFVSDEMSNFGRAKASETRDRIDCLRIAIGESCDGVPLIELAENVGPCPSGLRVVVQDLRRANLIARV